MPVDSALIAALREGLAAAADPAWVRDYVRGHDDRLSPLSRREAQKNTGAA